CTFRGERVWCRHRLVAHCEVFFTPPLCPHPFRLTSLPRFCRNVFFPWQVFSVHRTGAFLERRRVALKVPVNLTKFEIQSYLEKIYGARVLKVSTLIVVPRRRRDIFGPRPSMRYYRVGCTFKKAIVTLEDGVPDAVKMLRSSIELAKNPDITKHNLTYSGRVRAFKPPSAAQRWEMGESKYAWRLPIPNLLAGDEMQLNPALRIDESTTQMFPDFSKPFFHNAHFNFSWKPEEVPFQQTVKLDITPWRRRLERLQGQSPPALGEADAGALSNDRTQK
ncbi:putative 50S ribosomal protein L23, partial [Toxoplasma gondii RUB]